MANEKISSAVIRRLPRYYRYLSDLMNENVERISSEELSKRMGITASQIRQDLNNFGGFGQQGYGYNVEYLRGEVSRILGLDRVHSMIIIGGGNLGKALAMYSNFENRGFEITAIFDVDPDVIGTTVRNLTILPMTELETFLVYHNVDIAALAIPKECAMSVAGRLYDCGVRAFWNFAHLDLALPADAYIKNEHLVDSLMQLSYELESKKR